jgi:hypothetical protein
MAGTPLKNLELFEKICGRNWFDRVVLVTTMWDELWSEDMGERRERELRGSFWEGMISRGSRTERHQNSPDSAWDILRRLRDDSVARRREAEVKLKVQKMKLQKETADEGKALPKTDSGYKLYSQINETDKKRKVFIKTLNKQLARSDTDEDARRILEEQRDQLQRQSEAATLDMGHLAPSTRQKFLRNARKFF